MRCRWSDSRCRWFAAPARQTGTRQIAVAQQDFGRGGGRRGGAGTVDDDVGTAGDRRTGAAAADATERLDFEQAAAGQLGRRALQSAQIARNAGAQRAAPRIGKLLRARTWRSAGSDQTGQRSVACAEDATLPVRADARRATQRRSPTELKTVEAAEKAAAEPPPPNLADTLAKAMAARRGAVADAPSKPNLLADDDDDDDDWKD